jgi:predicted anti-sigma-YlaC factor YlaD
MKNLNCEYVRDVYPDILHGTAEPVIVHSVREHVASCDDCRAESALLDAIYARSVVTPEKLHERVLLASGNRRPARGISRSNLAMAATLAAALIGGSVLVQNQTTPRSSAPVSQGPAAASKSLGAVGVEDAMLSGKTSLEDLSEAQLEKLLKEIES